MGAKDVTEKALEAFDDVFADIANVLLFDGRRIMKEEDLEDALPRSHYKTDGRIRELERDAAKYWKKSNIRIALVGYENQTKPHKYSPIRDIGYDGVAYRSQLNDTDEKGNPKALYPVVTITLYFGPTPWNEPRTLHEVFDIPPDLKPYVNDYKSNIFEVAFLDDDTVSKFQSDFRIVADYFVQSRKNKGYTPTPQVVKHVNAVLELMGAITGDDRFEQAMNTADSEGGGEIMAEAILDRIEARGIEKGIKKGRQEGRREGMEKGILSSIKNLMESMGWTAEAAMNALKLSKEDQLKYSSLLVK